MREGIDSMNLKNVLTVVFALLFVSFGSLHGVSAHAELDRSNPEANQTVQGSPEMVEIWFTQEISADSKIEVTDEAGQSVTTGAAELDLFDPDRKHLTVELKSNLADGVYTVAWTSVSAEDGDAESDSFTFAITGSGTPAASPVASPVGTPAGTPPAEKVSGSLQSNQPVAQKANIDDRALLIAFGVGLLAALFIYGFWRLVRPKRHPFDRTGR